MYLNLKSKLLALTVVLLLTPIAHANTIDCTQLTVSEIKTALDKGKITSTQCMKQFLIRINHISPIHTPNVVTDYAGLQTFTGLNAFTFLNPDALAQAREADRLRVAGVKKPLLGVPIAIKDNIPVTGFNNSAGNFFLQGFQPSINDPAIQRLLDAGAILIGQNNMHEYALGDTSINFSYGPVRNPYDQTKIAGGSSGGGAAAVAAQLAPAAIGNDIGGSLRQPPSLSGVIGFRPSISRYVSTNSSAQFVPFNPTGTNISLKDAMWTNGIIAKSIADVVLLDEQLAENGGVIIKARHNLDGIRLGIPANFYQNMDPTIIPVVNHALEKLAARGAILVHTPNIPNLDLATPVAGLIGPMTSFRDIWINRVGLIVALHTSSWSQINNMTLQPTSPDVAASAFLINFLFSLAFPNPATAIQEASGFYNQVLLPLSMGMYGAYQQYFQDNDLDAIIYPTTLIPAASIETIIVNGGNPLQNGLNFGVFDFLYTSNGVTNGIGNFYQFQTVLSPVLGTPSLSMPIGLTNEGLPVGMLIEGLQGSDAKVLEIGSVFEHIFCIPKPSMNNDGTNQGKSCKE